MTTQFPDFLRPQNESARLRTLHQFDIVNTTPEPVFDEYAAWAAQLFGTPIALISLVDAEQVWFKATVGTDVTSLMRDESMCAAAILAPERVVVNDYQPDSCRLIKPDVAQAIGLNFYAGAQLHAPDGTRLGMLAVIGKEKRALTPAEADLLASLADLVSETIALRRQYLGADQAAEWEDAQRELAHALDENAALARYLAARPSGLDLADAAVSQLLARRLGEVARVLARRLLPVS